METKNLHYEFTGETLKILHTGSEDYRNVTLHRIRATKNLPLHLVKKGDLGGWIEKKENLQGNAWVKDNAKVYGNAVVFGNALIFESAKVCERSKVLENAKVYGHATIEGEAVISGEPRISGNAFVSGKSRVRGRPFISDAVCIKGNSVVFANAHLEGKADVYGDAYIASDDDFCVFSKFGSVNRDTTFFKTLGRKVFVTCGCFKGTIEDFVKRVKETHGNNKFAEEYLAMVELVKIKFNL